MTPTIGAPLVMGNWKMYKTATQARAYMAALEPLLTTPCTAQLVVCAPYTAMHAVAERASACGVQLGAQELYPAQEGAYTGAISAPMLVDAGVRYVLVGHSERRQLFGETLQTSHLRLRAALEHGLVPVLCVGESLAEREQGTTQAVVGAQLRAAMAQLSPQQAAQVVIAYEPVWAIGTGKVASPTEAQSVHAFIRADLQASFGAVAAQMPILYGGSVKPDNAATLLSLPDVNGALVGGASLDPAAFVAIARAART